MDSVAVVSRGWSWRERNSLPPPGPPSTPQPLTSLLLFDPNTSNRIVTTNCCYLYTVSLTKRVCCPGDRVLLKRVCGGGGGGRGRRSTAIVWKALLLLLGGGGWRGVLYDLFIMQGKGAATIVGKVCVCGGGGGGCWVQQGLSVM